MGSYPFNTVVEGTKFLAQEPLVNHTQTSPRNLICFLIINMY